MGKVKTDKETKQPFQEPDFGIAGVEAHLKMLKNETEAIFNAPPPKPKKEEPKPEEKPADKPEGEAPAENGDKPPETAPDADVEMKPEQ